MKGDASFPHPLGTAYTRTASLPPHLNGFSRRANADNSDKWIADSVGTDLRRVSETLAHTHGRAKELIPSSLVLSYDQNLRCHCEIIKVIHVDGTLGKWHLHNRDTRTKNAGNTRDSRLKVESLKRE
jgi:hypothetical protein